MLLRKISRRSFLKSSTALLGAAGLLALVGYRERRRLSALASRKSKLS